jgi:hypothetical protein
MIQFRAESPEDGTRITLTTRTSGTEPKVSVANCSILDEDILTIIQIKYYLEGSGTDPEQVAKLLPRVVRELGEDWMQAKKNHLQSP